MRRNSGVNTFISVRNSNDPIRARAFILRVVRYFIWAIIYLTAFVVGGNTLSSSTPRAFANVQGAALVAACAHLAAG